MATGRKKGSPKTGGRQKGTRNKVTVEIREVALQHSKTALSELVRLMKEGQSEQVRIAACREILDRAHGKSRLSVEHSGEFTHKVDITSLSAREKMRRMALFLLEDRDAGALIDNETGTVMTTEGPDAND